MNESERVNFLLGSISELEEELEKIKSERDFFRKILKDYESIRKIHQQISEEFKKIDRNFQEEWWNRIE